MPQTRSQRMGLRLWGIADEPFWCSLKGSSTSSTSVICSSLMVVARRSSTAPRMALADTNEAWRSRASTWVAAGATVSLRLRQTCSSTRGDTEAGVPTAPLGCPTDTPSGAAHLVVVVGQLDAQRQRLRVDAVGAPHHQRQPVPLRLAAESVLEGGDVLVDDRRGVAQLRGQGGVDDVRRRQAEVDPPPLVADGLLDCGDERGHVVALLRLKFGDAVGVDARLAQRGQRLLGDAPPLRPALGGQQLDLQPAAQPRLVAEDRGDLRRRVAGYHVLSILRGVPSQPF